MKRSWRVREWRLVYTGHCNGSPLADWLEYRRTFWRIVFYVALLGGLVHVHGVVFSCAMFDM
jgi:hypothetical protein